MGQTDLRKAPSKYKPVKWMELCTRMAAESHKRGSDDFRALHPDSVALAWDHKVWRFEGEMNLFPVFDKKSGVKWTVWIASADGVKWRKG